MNKNKLLNIIEGAVIVALGVLVAVFGGGEVVDIYFGISATVIGAALLGVSIYALVKKQLAFATLSLGAILIAIGVGLFTDYLSFTMLINIVVVAIIGLGAALVIYGIYQIANKETLFGTLLIVVGAILVTLATLFITIAEFRTAFWIIIGVVIALYGVLYIVLAVLDKKAITKK